MKNITYLLLIATLLFSCKEEVLKDTDFLNSTAVAENLKLDYTVSTDNKGKATFSPSANGVLFYTIDFGDGTPKSGKIKPGDQVSHNYAEGNYKVTLNASNVIGKITSKKFDINVVYKAPQNVKVVLENDPNISRKVNITVTADFAKTYEVYFGEAGKDNPLKGNIGETVSYTYGEEGTYSARIVVKGAAKATTTVNKQTQPKNISQPVSPAPTPTTRNANNYISIYSDTYTSIAGVNTFPDWGQAGQGSNWSTFKIGANSILKYGKLSYQGIEFTKKDVSGMSHLHLDIWTPNNGVNIKIFLINESPKSEQFIEKRLNGGQWTSINIPLSDYTAKGLPLSKIFQFKFEEKARPWAKNDVYIDNIYFYK